MSSNGLNRRIGKKVNGALVQGLLYQDNLNQAAELDSAGNVVSRFVYVSKLTCAGDMTPRRQRYRMAYYKRSAGQIRDWWSMLQTGNVGAKNRLS